MKAGSDMQTEPWMEAAAREILLNANGDLDTAEATAIIARHAAARQEWVPIEQAPRTGEHILVTALGKGGFGICGGVTQDCCAVAHWWSNPGEEGWYLSSGNDDNALLWPTHFKYITPPIADHDKKQVSAWGFSGYITVLPAAPAPTAAEESKP